MILLANTVHLHGKMSYMLQVWGEHYASIDLPRHVQTGCLAELAQLRCHGGHVMTEADGAEALGILCVHTNGPPIARSAIFTLVSLPTPD